MVVTLMSAKIKNGVKIENVLLKKKCQTVFYVKIDCHKGLLSKMKPYGFTVFAKRYGLEALLDCLERNEKNGVIYHREGLTGDYENFGDLEKLIEFIKSGV